MTARLHSASPSADAQRRRVWTLGPSAPRRESAPSTECLGARTPHAPPSSEPAPATRTRCQIECEAAGLPHNHTHGFIKRIVDDARATHVHGVHWHAREVDAGASHHLPARTYRQQWARQCSTTMAVRHAHPTDAMTSTTPGRTWTCCFHDNAAHHVCNDAAVAHTWTRLDTCHTWWPSKCDGGRPASSTKRCNCASTSLST
jgi:hypothetical protein